MEKYTVHGFEVSVFFKMSFLTWSTDSMHHQLKTLASYFVVIDKMVLKSTWEEKDLE